MQVGKVERVDAVPLIYGMLERMGIERIVDSIIGRHGNWEGISPGKVIVLWLVHILSEHNHRMEPVRLWAKRRIELLRMLTGEEVRELDFTDDRLGLCLEKLSEVGIWYKIEERLGVELIRVYELKPEVIRLDATVGGVNHEGDESKILKVGKAKDGSYEKQFKVMVASLDPLGLPIVCDVEAGNRADDPLYIPSYERVKEIVGEDGRLYVGDSKMSAFKTRQTIAEGGDYYLTPLPESELLAELMADWEEKGDEESLIYIFLPQDIPEDGRKPDPGKAIAYGFEVTRMQTHVVKDEEGKLMDEFEWPERLVVLCSKSYQQSQRESLRKRIEKAQEAFKKVTPPRGRGKRQVQSEAELRGKIEQIEQKYRVKGLFDYQYEREEEVHQVRKHKDKEARTETKVRYQLHATHNQDAIDEAMRKVGWRIYTTNAPHVSLPLDMVALTYRHQIVAENIFRRLNGKILSITPLYLRRDDHIQGLVHLLTLGSRFLALCDYLAKDTLKKEAEAGGCAELSGLYAGNPKRSTATPTTESMLKAFDNIHLVFLSLPRLDSDDLLHDGSQQVQPDKPRVTVLTGFESLHERILALLGLDISLFARLQTA